MATRAFLATSLDGYIARADGALDWLEQAAAGSAGEDHGYAAFMAGIDVLVMGRRTFDKVCTFPEWPYAGRRVVILGRTLRDDDIPPSLRGSVTTDPGPPAALLGRLAAGGFRAAYIDGGQVVQSFLREGLLDELTVTQVPVLLGGGIPLFGALPGDVRLAHARTTVFAGGLVQTTWRLVRAVA